MDLPVRVAEKDTSSLNCCIHLLEWQAAPALLPSKENFSAATSSYASTARYVLYSMYMWVTVIECVTPSKVCVVFCRRGGKDSIGVRHCRSWPDSETKSESSSARCDDNGRPVYKQSVSQAVSITGQPREQSCSGACPDGLRLG